MQSHLCSPLVLLALGPKEPGHPALLPPCLLDWHQLCQTVPGKSRSRSCYVLGYLAASLALSAVASNSQTLCLNSVPKTAWYLGQGGTTTTDLTDL